MKNIVFLLDRLSTGGAERVATALANELCKVNEYKIYIITYIEKEIEEYCISDKVIRFDMPKQQYGRIATIFYKGRCLNRILKKINPYCVFSLTIPRTNAILIFSSLGRHYPLIISERNDPEQFPTEKVMRIIRTMSYMLCDGVVFQTNGAKNFFPQSIRRKAVVIPNPLTEDLPRRYLGRRKKKIVNFCRIEPQKNLKMAIDSFRIIADEFDEYTLEFWGEGSQKETLKQYAKDCGINSRVYFHSYSSNIHKEIWDASIFVSTSDFEGISNSMLEAMAIGLPTICTDCPPGGAREIIHDGYNGKLVPVGDTQALADAIKSLLSDPQKMEKLSMHAIELRQNLQVKTISKEWINFMEEVEKKRLKKYDRKNWE